MISAQCTKECLIEKTNVLCSKLTLIAATEGQIHDKYCESEFEYLV